MNILLIFHVQKKCCALIDENKTKTIVGSRIAKRVTIDKHYIVSGNNGQFEPGPTKLCYQGWKQSGTSNNLAR